MTPGDVFRPGLKSRVSDGTRTRIPPPSAGPERIAKPIELPPEPVPERRERLRLHNYRNRGGRQITSSLDGLSAPGRPEHEHAKLLSQLAGAGKPFKPYVWRDPARTGKPQDEATS